MFKLYHFRLKMCFIRCDPCGTGYKGPLVSPKENT